MTDRELLEFAAKAAETRLFIWGKKGVKNYTIKNADGSPGARWNPLTDDGDAFRLAVKLRIDAKPVYEWSGPWVDGGTLQDPYAATRRAIVRAAAEIGKGIAQPKPADGLPEDNYYKSMAEAEELGRLATGKALP